MKVAHIVRRKSIQQLQKQLDETRLSEKTTHSESKIAYKVQLRVPIHLKGYHGFVVSPLSIELKGQGDFSRISFNVRFRKFLVFSVIASCICSLPFLFVDYGWITYSIVALILFILLNFYFTNQLEKRVEKLIVELGI